MALGKELLEALASKTLIQYDNNPLDRIFPIWHPAAVHQTAVASVLILIDPLEQERREG